MKQICGKVQRQPSFVWCAAAIVALVTLGVSALAQSHSRPASSNGSMANWRSYLENGRVVYSRRDGPSPRTEAQEASWISLAELATWCNPRGIHFRIVGALILIATNDGDGSASFDFQSGQVSQATGVLSDLAGKTLPRSVRKSGQGWFLMPDGNDYLIGTTWLSRLFRAGERSADHTGMNLRSFPGAMLPPVEFLNKDIAVQQREEFATAHLADRGLAITVKGFLARLHNLNGDRTPKEEVLVYSAEFINRNPESQLVQPSLLRPLASGRLDFAAPPKTPLGPTDPFDFSYLDRGFPWSTYLLKPGESLIVPEVVIHLPLEPLEHAHGPIIMQYFDGIRDLTFSLEYTGDAIH